MPSMFFTLVVVRIFHCPNLDRKTHLSLSPMANLPLRWTFAHPAPSVFHADQCGVLEFLNQTLWAEFHGAIPIPMGNPNISKTRNCF